MMWSRVRVPLETRLKCHERVFQHNRPQAVIHATTSMSMKTLADIAIDYFSLLMFEGPLDAEDASALSQAIPVYLEAMSPDERVAFSAAAQRALDRLTAPPDEHGYSPRTTVKQDELAFLKSAAAGDIFGG